MVLFADDTNMPVEIKTWMLFSESEIGFWNS